MASLMATPAIVFVLGTVERASVSGTWRFILLCAGLIPTDCPIECSGPEQT